MKNEFQTLQGKTLEEVCREVKALHTKLGLGAYNKEETEEDVRWLLALDVLMQEAYTQLPIEVTRRRRTQKEAIQMEEFHGELNALDEARRRSLELACTHVLD